MNTKVFALISALVALVACNRQEPIVDPDPDPVTFDLQVSDIASYSAKVSIDVSDKTARYIYDCLPSYLVEQYETDEDLYNADMKYYKTLFEYDKEKSFYIYAIDKRPEHQLQRHHGAYFHDSGVQSRVSRQGDLA